MAGDPLTTTQPRHGSGRAPCWWAPFSRNPAKAVTPPLARDGGTAVVAALPSTSRAAPDRGQQPPRLVVTVLSSLLLSSSGRWLQPRPLSRGHYPRVARSSARIQLSPPPPFQPTHISIPEASPHARAADAAAVSFSCFKKGEMMQQPRIPVVVLQKTLLPPVLQKGPGSVLPAQTNAENTVSSRAKPSLDVSQQSSAEPVRLTSPKNLPRVCPQVDNLISLLIKDGKHNLDHSEVPLPKSVFVLQHSHGLQTSAAL